MRSSALNILIIAVLGLILYSNTFGVPFTFDDTDYIENNPALKDLSFFAHPSKMDQSDMHPSIKTSFRARILGHLSLALNFKLHGYKPAGYHMVNLALHIGMSLLVWLFLLLTFRMPLFSSKVPGDKSPPYEFIALSSALVFAAHPVQTEAVTYIAQRFTLLAAFFYLLSLVLYIKGRLSSGRDRFIFFSASLLSALFAMLSKQNAFTLPIAAGLYELMFFEGSIKKRLKFILPLILTLPIVPFAIFMSGRGKGLGETMSQMAISKGIPKLFYLFTQFRVIARYLRLIFLPTGLNLDYDFPVFTSLLDSKVLGSFLLLLLIGAFGIYIYLRSRRGEKAGFMRLFSFGIFWFFITLSVESSFIPIGDLIFEYRLYLPLSVFIPAILAGCYLLIERINLNPKASLALVIAALLALSVSAYARNSLWRDPVRLWEDTVKKSPMKARTHFNLGASYVDVGRTLDAEREFRAAVQLMPRNAEFHERLANLYERMDRLPEAQAELETAILLDPAYAQAWSLLGIVLAREGRPDGAERAFLKAIELKPYYAEPYGNLAILCEQLGKTEQALRAHQNALRLAPDDPDIRSAFEAFYLRHGQGLRSGIGR
jgi:Flp pilus assembly protein TadD